MLRSTRNLHGPVVTNAFIQKNPDAVLYQETHVGGQVLGTNKWIDQDLVGRYQPGVYRENAVKMYEFSGSSVPSPPCESTFLYSGATLRGRRIDGDIAAYLTPVNVMPWKIGLTIPPFRDSMGSESAAKAYGRLNEAETDAAMILAELGETIGMLRNPLAALRKMLQLWKTTANKRRKTASFIDALSGSWLEYRYGIMPLIMDIEMIMDEIEGQLGLSCSFIHKKRGTSRYKTSTDYVGTDYVFGEILVDRRTTELIEWKTVTTVSYNIDAGWDTTRRLAHWGFSPNQWLSIAWELVPFSFVADWFVNFGAWLAAVMPKPYIKVLGASTSWKVTREISTKIDRVYVSQPTWTPQVMPCSSYYYGVENYLERTLQTPIPVTPVINAKILNIKRALDSLSLIWQLVPRRFKRKLWD